MSFYGLDIGVLELGSEIFRFLSRSLDLGLGLVFGLGSSLELGDWMGYGKRRNGWT